MSKYNITYTCSKCKKDFDEGQHPGYFIVFDKCRGKTCPDCGRIRKSGRIKCFYENLSKLGSEGRSLFGCPRCDKTREYFFNGVCSDCFYEIQKQKNNCVCWFEAIKHGKGYYCFFCEEFHGPRDSVVCKKCAKKQDSQNANFQQKEAFLSVGLPSILIGIVIGFFLGWMFFVVLKKKKKN